jgi:hypothetical protein
MITGKQKKYKLINPFIVFYFSIISLIFLVARDISMVYLVMGLRQLTIRQSENNSIKKKAGIRTIVISALL